MAKSVVATAALMGGWCTSANAQSITLYGIIDTGVEYLHNANAAGKSVVRMAGVTGDVPSRWGLKGSESLGDGYKAIFTLENGFNPGTGALGQGGRLFGRQAFVGIDGPPGTLTFGRQYSTFVWAVLFSGDFIGPNVYGGGSLDPWLGVPRHDNSVVYRKSFGNLSIGASYSFGRDSVGSNTPGEGSCAGAIAGNAEACREWSVLLQYGTKSAGAAVAYDRQNGGPGSAVNLFNGLTPLPMTGSGNRDSRLLVDGYLRFGQFMLGTAWIHRRVEVTSLVTPSITSNQFELSVEYKITPALVADGMLQRIVNRQQDTRATMEMLRVTYALSARTAVYGQMGFLENSKDAAYSVSVNGGTPGKGMNQSGAMIGMQHAF